MDFSIPDCGLTFKDLKLMVLVLFLFFFFKNVSVAGWLVRVDTKPVMTQKFTEILEENGENNPDNYTEHLD